jgi:hypothetical protein
MFGWILILIGIIFAILGVGGSAKLELGEKSIVITAMGGIILIIVGVLFMSWGI